MMGHVTGIYAVPLAALFLILSLRVITYRRGKKISLGDGDDPLSVNGYIHLAGNGRHNRESSPSPSLRLKAIACRATGQGSKGGPSGYRPWSKGGWTTKILALTDALGNLVRFMLMPGNRHDTVGVAPLIKGLKFDARLADKAFDSNWIIEDMNERGALICISQRPQRLEPLQIDLELYKSRHLIENFFAQTQRLQAHCHARRQNRHLLRGHDLRDSRTHKFKMNLNRP